MLIRDRGQQGRIGRIVPRESIETQPFIYGPAFCIEIAMHETSRKANERQPILEVTREHPSIKWNCIIFNAFDKPDHLDYNHFNVEHT